MYDARLASPAMSDAHGETLTAPKSCKLQNAHPPSDRWKDRCRLAHKLFHRSFILADRHAASKYKRTLGRTTLVTHSFIYTSTCPEDSHGIQPQYATCLYDVLTTIAVFFGVLAAMANEAPSSFTVMATGQIEAAEVMLLAIHAIVANLLGT